MTGEQFCSEWKTALQWDAVGLMRSGGRPSPRPSPHPMGRGGWFLVERVPRVAGCRPYPGLMSGRPAGAAKD
jgi:hypothetical protein